MSSTGNSAPKRKRSKTGCGPCRLRRVKCDEQSPECGRCCRIGLVCSKPEPRAQLQQRRRGSGPIKSRTSWVPQKIAPNANAGSNLLDNPCVHFPQVVSQTSLPSIEESGADPMPTSSPPAVDIVDALVPEFIPARTPRIEKPIEYTSEIILPAEDADWSSTLPTYEEMGSIPTATIGSLQPLDTGFINEESTGVMHALEPYTRTTSPLPHPLVLSPPSIFSWPSAHDFPCMPELDTGERRALDYYRTVFSPSRSLKGFTWSSYSIFLRAAAYQETVLHFILALSLHGLMVDVGDNSLLCLSTHLDRGVQLLSQSLASEPYGDDECTAVLIASWFSMLFALDCDSSTQRSLDRGWLRSAVANFIRKHGVHSHGGAQATISKGAYGGISGEATNSLMAKMVCMLTCIDVQFDFRAYTGSLAMLVYRDTDEIHELAWQSRNVLQLCHGSEYPVREALYDVEGAECSRIFTEQQLLHDSINQLFWKGLGDYDELQARLDSLEKKCSALFHATETPALATSADYSRIQFQVDAAVSELYAIRIYHFRCRDQEPTKQIQSSVSSYLQIRHRMQKAAVRYSWFGRSMFIVGAEVDDRIHRDWILQHLVTPELEQMLTEVWAAQDIKGERLQMQELKAILLVSGTT